MSFGPPVTPTIIKQLLIANLAVFVIQFMMGGSAELYFAARPALVFQEGWLWQVATYMWLHDTQHIGHILMNMFTLWMFGSQLALVWGPKRFLRFYLICGVGAGVIIAAFPYVLVGIGIAPMEILTIATLGASGAVYGVLLAYSLTWPDRTIMLIFPPVAFRAIWLIPGLFFMSIFFGGNNVSHTGHLGGVVVAWFYLKRSGTTGNPLSLDRLKYRWRRHRMRRNLRAVPTPDRRRPFDDKTLH